MNDRLRLARVCERASTSDRTVELEIWRLNGGTCPPGKVPQAWLHCYTSSVNAALSLCPADVTGRIMREAVYRLEQRFELRENAWPKELDYAEHLARFVTAAALRLLDKQHRNETGEAVDILEYDLPEACLENGEGVLRLTVDEAREAGMDERPMARMWAMIVDMLAYEGVAPDSPDPVTDEMIAAGRQAYDAKSGDIWNPSPTEHPADGGGPVGYAWRAMLKTQRGMTA